MRNPVVSRIQYFEYFSSDGRLVWKRILPMRFELIERASFEKMVGDVGFTVENLLGDYQGSQFDTRSSPVMIWKLRKPE